MNKKPLGRSSKSYFIPLAREFVTRRKVTKLQDRGK
jgi:hypothetical protein